VNPAEALAVANITFAVGGFIFVLALLPTLYHRESEVPRGSSFPTAAVLTVFLGAYYLLGTWLAFGSDALLATAWWAVFVFRPLNVNGRLTEERQPV
jgi:hypothetical protein